MALSLVSINIERDKHFERFLPFLVEAHPDVVCVMELFETHIPRIAEALGAEYCYAPMTRYEGNVEGIGIFSRTPILSSEVRQYGGNPGPVTDFSETTLEDKQATQKYLLLLACIEKEGVPYTVAATHFTWTPNGQADHFQRKDVASLLASLGTQEVVLCGDFNAPRGGEIFATLAGRYKDNIPPQYMTSIDVELHRAGKTEGDRLGTYMVDGLFTTPEYVASNVSLQFGVSDHAAIVATITKTA